MPKKNEGGYVLVDRTAVKGYYPSEENLTDEDRLMPEDLDEQEGDEGENPGDKKKK